MTLARIFYWKIFRLFFVIFSLYIVGDVLSRWDGFKYYASFPEFLASVALITILWSIVAMLTTVLVWFDTSPELRTKVSLGKGMERGFKYRFIYPYFPKEVQPTVDTLRARYDEFIRYCDKQFEDFIMELTARNILKNTAVILSSDHGESFEHGNLGHRGPQLYEQITNIPLIIKEPNQTKGQIINSLVEQIDIPATILDLAHIPAPSWMEGRSFLPLMHDKWLPSKPAFSMNFENNPSRGHEITKGIVAVWEGDYKLIHYLEMKKSLLFDLKEDPGELNNLFDKEHEVGQHLLSLIQDNLKNANEKILKMDHSLENPE